MQSARENMTKKDIYAIYFFEKIFDKNLKAWFYHA
jgi:hypothetical protein